MPAKTPTTKRPAARPAAKPARAPRPRRAAAPAAEPAPTYAHSLNFHGYNDVAEGDRLTLDGVPYTVAHVDRGADFVACYLLPTEG